MKALYMLGKLTSRRHSQSDQRSRNRIPSRYYAHLHSTTGTELSDCLIKDISEAGARIVLPKQASLPKLIMLRVTGETAPMDASVVWQVGAKCGLKFDDAGSA